jgi:hypothetical protein
MAVLENYNITAKALNKDEEEERWIVSLSMMTILWQNIK